MEYLKYVPTILSYGLIALAFLLAGLAFVLLSMQRRTRKPNSEMLKAIKTFMILSIVLGLGAGSIEILKPAEPIRANEMGAKISQEAQHAFLSGGSSEALEGKWTAKWYIGEGVNRDKYYDNPREIITCEINGAEIWCAANDPTTYLTYWLHGRISTANNVTLSYWSQRDVPEKVLTGIVFLQFPEERDKGLLKLKGWWRGYTRKGEVISGEVFWRKKA